MPSIIPVLPIRPSPVNVTARVPLLSNFTVALGQYYYYTPSGASDFLFLEPGLGFNTTDTLTNNGTLWISGNGSERLLQALNFGTINNAGIAIAESSNGNTRTFSILSTWVGGLTNSGTVMALSTNGSAIAVEDYSPLAMVSNSGTIASRTNFGASVAVWRHNGGAINNLATGSILAEGPGAIAIRTASGFGVPSGTPNINNAGRIEAASTDPTLASIAIQVDMGLGAFVVVNNGVIRGDFAYYANPYNFSPPSQGTTYFTNNIGGTINGDMVFALGGDTLINNGAITGNISAGDGDDMIDTRLGSIQGRTSLEFGNDTYLGSAGVDVVLGDRGNDRIEGNGGDDLLIGDRGDDTLIGGAGNDGLYGSFGNDVLTTLGGDRALGGTGNDRIELGDYSFASVDGEEGYDTLVFATGARVFDLSLMLSANRIFNFEALTLRGSQELVVRATDIAALTGGQQGLVISGGATDKIDLVGSWADSGVLTAILSTVYRTFTSGANTLYIQQGITVVIGVAAPAAATGLDSITAGAAAPLPGSLPGTALLTNLTIANQFELTESILIEKGEIWQSEGGQAIFRSYNPSYILTNNGTLQSTNPAGLAVAVGTYSARVVNNGTILAAGGTNPFGMYDAIYRQTAYDYGTIFRGGNSEYNAFGIDSGGPTVILNSGRISVTSASGAAVGAITYLAPSLSQVAITNTGRVEVTSSLLLGVGLQLANGGLLENSGTIIARGAIQAIGVRATTWVPVINNSGLIESITTGPAQIFEGSGLNNGGPIGMVAPSIGIYATGGITFFGSVGTRVTNSGTIRADVAIRANVDSSTIIENLSAGLISGIIDLGSGNDNVRNIGTINGAVYLYGGNDVYNASSGTQNGAVYGGDGNDQIVGGITADQLYGGQGNDDLQGGQGNDRIFGGSGTDIVFYTTAIGAATVTRLANGTVRVITASEGTDYLRGIETFNFANATQTLTAYAAQDSNGDGDSDGLYFSQSTGLIYRTDFVNGAAVANTVLGNMGSGDWDVQAGGDFNYDGTSDLVLKNAVTGQFYVWTVTNGVQTGGFNLGTIGTNWNIASTGADGNHDLLWRDASNGHLYVWTFNASGAQTGSASLGIIGTDWTAGKSGDFDGDGDSDVLLRNSNTGQVYIYTMQNGALAGGRSVGVFGTDWGLAATGDFNGDGISDIILKNGVTGQFYEFLMNSDGSSTGVNLGIIGTDWNIATSGDYNKDGTDDILWRNTSTGQVYLWAMEDGLQAATGSGSLGPIANDLVIV
jgi:hypothetical protein